MQLSRITRLIELIGLLQTGKGRNAAALARECEVSRRTIFRDLDVLRLAGVPLAYDDEAQLYRIPRTFFLPPTNFTPEEALALLVLCSELGDRGGVPFHEPARRAALKVENSLPAKLRDYLRDVTAAIELRIDATNPLSNHDATFQLLLGAAAGRRCVRIEYQSFSEGKAIATKLSPYRLLFDRRSWYVIGRSSLHRETRTFNVGRVVQLELLDESFRPPRGFSIDRYLGNAWRIVPERGPDHEVVILFDKLVAGNVAEVAWHRTQCTRTLADGRLEFRATVSGIQEISWWILGYGDQAEVVAPESLRNLIRQRAEKMVARYASVPASSERKKATPAAKLQERS